MIIVWIVIAVVVVLLAWAMVTYNRFVRLRNESKQAFANIEAQLKRRADLIPNLVETVKGYAAHESGTFEAVAAARAAANSASTPAQVAAADGQMHAAAAGLFAVAEGYPELKASENFLQLQGELDTTESLIAQSRTMYNAPVRRFNTLLEQFPPSIIGGLGHFQRLEFFEAGDGDRANTNVSFT